METVACAKNCPCCRFTAYFDPPLHERRVGEATDFSQVSGTQAADVQRRGPLQGYSRVQFQAGRHGDRASHADAKIEPVSTEGGRHKPEPELDRLSNIRAFNDHFCNISDCLTSVS